MSSKKVIIAPDKFKASLTAIQFCAAAEKGLKEANPQIQLIKLPLSDGGEGFTDVMNLYGALSWKYCEAHDPLFRKIKTKYLISADGLTAVIEMAKISGLGLLKPEQRNCALTSTFGLGETILHAISCGVEKIIIGLGGSATNDGGIGMARALGYTFYDEEGKLVYPIGENLNLIRKIEQGKSYNRVTDIDFLVVTDVQNPLCGEFGSTNIYAKQKGARENQIESLERGMKNLACQLKQNFGMDVCEIKGAGAAGGLGAGALTFLNARLVSGAKYVIDQSNLTYHLNDADLLITGEGKLDDQSTFGKLTYEVTKLANRFKVPSYLIVGEDAMKKENHKILGAMEVFSLITDKINREQAIGRAAHYVKINAYKIGKRISG